jgi:opacity protein-like surface antigen
MLLRKQFERQGNNTKIIVMTSLKNLLAGLVLLFSPLCVFSQDYWEVSITPGAIVYFGDLTVPNVTFKETHLAGQINIKRYFKGEHALRFNVIHGTISGSDFNYDRLSTRGNSFVGRLTEFSLMGEIDLKGRRRFSKKLGYQRTTSPYVMGGFSGIYSKPDVVYGEPDSKDKGVDYPDWHFGIPVGGGLKFDLNEHVVFGVEVGIHLTLSDYLDGTQASGNSYKNDAIFFGGLTAGYRFMKVKKAAVDKA